MMASSDRDKSFDECDSSGSEYQPGSNSETASDDETEEDMELYRSDGKNSEVNTDFEKSKDIEKNAESKFKKARKRCNTHLEAPKGKRSKMSRNKTHASKLECCDNQEIKKWLHSNKRCCKEKCLKKLKKHRNKAIHALSELRHQRFAGQLKDLHEIFHHTRLHPGVKIIS